MTIQHSVRMIGAALLIVLAPALLYAEQKISLPIEAVNPAVVVAETTRGRLRWLIVGMIAAQAADIATTSIALHRGCVESTYYGLQNTWAIAGLKGSGTIALTVTLPVLNRKKPGLTKAVAWAQIASGALGAAFNATRLPHCR